MPKSHPVPNIFSSACPSRRVMAVLAEKWTLLIVTTLAEGPKRTAEIRRSVDGISEKMLIQTLRKLEGYALVSRKSYPEVPPRVEYALTPLGATLRQLVRALVAWSGDHLAEVDLARAAYDAKNGRTSRSPSLPRPAASVRSRASRAAG